MSWPRRSDVFECCVALFTDSHPEFYSSLGFRPANGGMKIVVGTWLDR